VAAIDCGTNSTRLLVTNGAPRPLLRLMRITRLGQDVAAKGRLLPQAIERTVEVLREFRSLMNGHGVEAVRMTATSAARDAANRADFFAAAEAVIGVAPELLSGEEEGRLAFAGATDGLDRGAGPFLVVDIGGGSTELIVGTTEPVGICSLPLGCVRVTERFVHHDPPAAAELSDALLEVRDQLDDAVRTLPALRQGRRMLGLAGTITTVAAVEQGLSSYDPELVHHFVLTRAATEDVFRTLATEAHADRLHNPGLEPARADVIVGGCVVLAGVMRFFDFGECLVSEADLLDGLAASLLGAGAG